MSKQAQRSALYDKENDCELNKMLFLMLGTEITKT